jgi:hypothetical protein
MVLRKATYLIDAIDPKILKCGVAGHMRSNKCSNGKD